MWKVDGHILHFTHMIIMKMMMMLIIQNIISVFSFVEIVVVDCGFHLENPVVHKSLKNLKFLINPLI